MNSEQSSSRPLPDLYDLLGLNALESDSAVIKAALLRWQAKAENAENSQPTQARRVKRLVGLGRRNLLDPVRKSAYDALWREKYGGELVVASAIRPRQLAGQTLEELLPSQDPREPFDLSAYLENASVEAEPDWQTNWDTEFQQLCDRLTTASHQSDAEPESFDGTLARDVGASEVLATAPPSQSNSPTAVAMSPGTPPLVLGEASEGADSQHSRRLGVDVVAFRLAKSRRRRRERGVLYMAIGALAGTAALLYVTFLLLNRESPAGAAQAKKVAENGIQGNGADATAAPQQNRPRSSGLPQVAGLDSTADLTPDPNLFQLDSETGGMLRETVDENRRSDSISAPVVAADRPTMGDGELDTDASDLLNSADMTSTADTASSPDMSNAEVELDEDQQEQWKSSLATVQRELRQLNFDAVSPPMLTLEQLAQSTERRAELNQWKSIVSLAESAHRNLIEAIEGLGAAEVVSIGGTTQISFIEGNSERLVVKFRGETQRYPIREIPLGIANGIMDLKMPSSDPRTAASKAVFALLRPSLNQRIRNRSLETLRQAEINGIVPTGVAVRLETFSAE